MIHTFIFNSEHRIVNLIMQVKVQMNRKTIFIKGIRKVTHPLTSEMTVELNTKMIKTL